MQYRGDKSLPKDRRDRKPVNPFTQPDEPMEHGSDVYDKNSLALTLLQKRARFSNNLDTSILGRFPRKLTEFPGDQSKSGPMRDETADRQLLIRRREQHHFESLAMPNSTVTDGSDKSPTLVAERFRITDRATLTSLVGKPARQIARALRLTRVTSGPSNPVPMPKIRKIRQWWRIKREVDL